MNDLKSHFSRLILTSALAGAGGALAQPAAEPSKETQPHTSASEHCLSLDSKNTEDGEKRFNACMDLARVVEALKTGNSQTIQDALNGSKGKTTPAPVALPKPSSP